MAQRHTTPRSSGRDIYNASLSGALDRPLIPRLRSDPIYHTFPHTLQEFRDWEGRENRKRRLQVLWKRLSIPPHDDREFHMSTSDTADTDRLMRDKAESLKLMYDNELLGRCGHSSALNQIGWKEFKEYAEAKEVGESSWILSSLLCLEYPSVTRTMVHLPRRTRLGW
jgi:solute carrier family 25 (mitochondrial phosphate transporter), member 23/24/25/41